MPRLLFRITLLLVLGSGLQAQSASPPPLAVSADTYTHIAATAELPDGSVIVLDNRDRAIWRLTPDLLQRTPVSRQGDGPGELRSPSQLAQSGDTIVAWDFSLGRATRCVASATACSTLSLPLGYRFFALAGIDAHAGVFLTVLRGPTGEPSSDSTVVLRIQTTTGRFDTVAAVANGPTYAMVRRTGGRTDRLVVPVPLVAGDQVAVTTDGTLWVIPNSGAMLTRYRSGATAVPLVPRPTVVAFTRAERDSLLRAADSSGFGESLRASLPSSKGAVAPHAFLVGPADRLWVGLNRSGGGSAYEVVAPDGRRLGTIPMPLSSRLVGVGATRYYVVVRNADDLESLLAYQVPLFATRS